MPHDTCLHCRRPRKRVVRSQKRASAFRKRYGVSLSTIRIYCITPNGKHKFSKDTE